MPDYRITTGLPQLPSALDDKAFNLVLPLYSAMNALAKALSQAEGAIDYTQIELAQRNQLGSITTQNHRQLFAINPDVVALPFGILVNLYLDAGKIAVRKADATDNTKPCHGIVNNPQGIEPGQYGQILLVEGYTLGITGTTLGSYYYLGTGGLASLVRPSLPATIIQAVGFGLGSAGFYLHVSPLFAQN